MNENTNELLPGLYGSVIDRSRVVGICRYHKTAMTVKTMKTVDIGRLGEDEAAKILKKKKRTPIKCGVRLRLLWCSKRDSNPHGCEPVDFESTASTIPPFEHEKIITNKNQ